MRGQRCAYCAGTSADGPRTISAPNLGMAIDFAMCIAVIVTSERTTASRGALVQPCVI